MVLRRLSQDIINFPFRQMVDLKYMGTWVHVLKNGRKLANWSIGDSDNNQWSDGNNISHDWIWKLNKNDKVTFEVQRGTYLSGLPRAPVNFNGQLVLVEA